MGVRFLMENRRRAKSLGGRELSLDEARALRMVLHKMGRATEAQLASMDADIQRMESVKLLEDLENLRVINAPTLVKMERGPSTRLLRDDKVHILAWLARIEELQRKHYRHLHVGHLLKDVDSTDPIIRDLNLAFLHLAVVSHADDYWERGLISDDRTALDDRLCDAVDAMTAKSPLVDYLEAGPWFGPPRVLRALPADRIQRARLLYIYQDYVELAMVANAWGNPAPLLLPTMGRQRELLGYNDLSALPNPDQWARTMLERIGASISFTTPTRGLSV